MLTNLFYNWTQLIELNYSINPMVFVIIYLVTFIPCWYFLFLIYKSIKRKSSITVLVLIEIFLLILPYLYILALGRNVPIWVYVLIVFIVGISVYDLWRRIHYSANINSTQIFWNIYAIFYRGVIYQSQPHASMFKDVCTELNLKGNFKILDAGCGAGDLIYYLSKNSTTNNTIIGIDFSSQMLKKAKKRFANNKNIFFKKVDLTAKLPFSDNSFDGIACISVLFSLPSARTTISELQRVLKKDGKIIVVEPTPEFNLVNIFRDHLSAVNNFTLMKRLLSYLLLVIKLPLLIILFLMNLFIDKWEKQGKYHYFSTTEFHKILSDLGFRNIQIKKTLSNQDNLYIANK